MAAFTEGFSYHGNNIDVVSKVLAARSLAKSEREYAEKVLSSQQRGVAEEDKLKLEDFGIKRGYFFRKALKHEFGGDLYLRKKEKISDIVARVKLLKNPRKNFFKLFEKRTPTTKFSRFRNQFDYKFETSDPAVQAKTPKIPSTAKKIQKATTGSGKRISREQLLESISDIVKSIGSVAASIESSSAEVKQNIISSNIAQTNIAEQLKTRNETLADKLDKIAAAISQQTQLQKHTAEKREDAQREAQLENVKDVASTTSFDDLTTKQDESKINSNIDNDITPITPITNVQNIIPATSAQRIEHEQMAAYGNMPQMERGGIVSGPDSGYLAKLHGDEMIVPLDNNYTQGQPSAVDGKTRKKPQMFEKGTSGVGGKFGFGITKNLGIGDTFAASITNMSQPLVDAMSLPMMVAGGSVIAATTNLMKNLGESGEELRPEIEKFARPVSDAFGVPTSVMNKAKSGIGKVGGKSGEDGKEDKDSKKNIIAKMLDGFGAFLDKMKESINTNPPPPGPGSNQLIPGNAPPEIKALMETISGGEGGPNSVQGIGEVPGLSDMTIDQAIEKAKSYIGKGSQTGALGAYQFHSEYLRERAVNAGLDPSKDKFTFENQTQIMRNFMTSVWTAGGGTGGEAGLLNALQSGQIESSVFPKLSKDLGWPSLPGGSQPNVHTAGAGSRYQQSLKKYQRQIAQTPAPSAQPPQKISQNFGYSAGARVNFQYNGEEYHAYRDGNDWAFFKGTGLGATLLDRSGNKNKTVVDYFINLMQQRTAPPATQEVSFAPPASRETRTNQQVAVLNREVGADAGSTVAFLNMGSSVGGKSSLNTPQPTAQDISVSRGGNPIDSSGLYISQVG